MDRFLAGAAPIALALTVQPAFADPVTDAEAYAARIAALDDAGPELNAVIAYDSDPAAAAKAGAALPLAGATVLVKDNVETREWPTTAGSLALADNMTGRDAPIIAKLRASGGVVLGKTNLSEWANMRDNNSTSGWSAVGGVTRNPHATDRNTCGSSSGSGAAVAAHLAWAAIGTETDGSITCPASVNGIVGFKPTVGLVSRSLIVPISISQDTAGPMARSVADAARLLDAIAGPDPADKASAGVSAHMPADGYFKALAGASLKGVRLGVLRKSVGSRKDVGALFDKAVADLKAAGAEIVEIDYTPDDAMFGDELTVLLYELRTGMDAYLSGRPGTAGPRKLADLAAFNTANAGTELRWFGQFWFDKALETTDRVAYEKARANSLRLAGVDGIDRLLRDNRVTALLAPTTGPAWTTDLVNGDHYAGDIGAGSLAAIAGYPHLSVPMGAVESLPVGLSIMGGKWQDAEILRYGAAYEAARTAKLAEPSFKPWSPPARE